MFLKELKKIIMSIRYEAMLFLYNQESRQYVKILKTPFIIAFEFISFYLDLFYMQDSGDSSKTYQEKISAIDKTIYYLILNVVILFAMTTPYSFLSYFQILTTQSRVYFFEACRIAIVNCSKLFYRIGWELLSYPLKLVFMRVLIRAYLEMRPSLPNLDRDAIAPIIFWAVWVLIFSVLFSIDYGVLYVINIYLDYLILPVLEFPLIESTYMFFQAMMYKLYSFFCGEFREDIGRVYNSTEGFDDVSELHSSWNYGFYARIGVFIDELRSKLNDFNQDVLSKVKTNPSTIRPNNGIMLNTTGDPSGRSIPDRSMDRTLPS